MKLKENELLTNKGLEKNLSWTKVMIYLKSTLSYDELKEVLFSVEQTGQKKIGRKNMNKKYVAILMAAFIAAGLAFFSGIKT